MADFQEILKHIYTQEPRYSTSVVPDVKLYEKINKFNQDDNPPVSSKTRKLADFMIYGRMGAIELAVTYVVKAAECQVRGKIAEAIENYEEALRLVGNWDDFPELDRVHFQLGLLYYQKEDYTTAIEKLKTALTVNKTSGTLPQKAIILWWIGFVYLNMGKYSEVIPYFEQSAKIYTELKQYDTAKAVQAEIELEKRRQENPDRQAAKIIVADLDDILQEDQDLQGVKKKVINLNNLGEIYLTKKDYDNALKTYKEAMDISEPLGDLRIRATLLNNIGGINHYKGDYATALKLCAEALEINSKLGDKQAIAGNKLWIASILSKLGKKHKDESLLQAHEALELYRQLGLQDEMKLVEDFIKKLK